MEDSDLKYLEIEKDFNKISKVLNRFVQNNAQSFTFEFLDKNEKRQLFFTILFKLLSNDEAFECHKECLECLRILSRDKTGLGEALTEERISCLLNLANIHTGEVAMMKSNKANSSDVTVAALKILCNLVYNSPLAVKLVARSHAVEGILLRLRLVKEQKILPMIRLFDIKLLFLITALSPETRPILKHKLHGFIYLIESLDLILKDSSSISQHNHYVKLSDDDADLCCEILKVLFNLMAKSASINNIPLIDEDEEKTLCVKLTSALHDLLMCETSVEKNSELKNQIVNLLTSIPANCYIEIINANLDDIPKELEWEGKNMKAIEVLLQYLEQKLSLLEKDHKPKNKLELLSPILTVFLQMIKQERLIRKYLRYRILPPLKNATTRPEEGDSFRAKLCRLLTSPSSTVKDLTSEFLFILCKENVGRMIKYVGYGNAAGLFANKGIMFGGNKSNNSQSSYSSDSDSETEEYAKYSDKINPVTGCYEPQRPNPLEGMSEEQKEYEAVMLVNMLDKLSRDGVVQPCRVGEDGRPQPVQNIH